MSKHRPIFNWQLYAGILLVLTGGLFLADQWLGFRVMAKLWPLLVLLFGLSFFISMLAVGKRGAGLAIPGAVITTLGGLLFIQNLFNLWVTWTYAWSLLVIATGLGLLIMNAYLKRTGLRRAAGVVIGVGLVQYVVFGLFFEVILNIGGTDQLSGIFLGAGLILFGVFIIFSRLFFGPGQQNQAKAVPQVEVVDGVSSDLPESGKPEDAQPMPLDEVRTFTGIHFESVGEVFLIQGDACDVRIEGDPELVGKVTAQIQDETLKITYQVDINDWIGLQWISDENRLRYYLTVSALERLNMKGAGVIRAERLAGDSLAVSHEAIGAMALNGLSYKDISVTLGGLGEVRLSGEVETQTVQLKGGGSYQAYDLKSQQADVTLTGAGSVHVWVESHLRTRITGAGNVIYKGSPQVEPDNTGLGRVKPV